MSSKGRARVYIDGFNLYYGALKGTKEKWLDLSRWSAMLLPGYTIDRIVYCTARVSPRPHDPDTHVRQDAYIRALSTLPNVHVIEGKFNVSKPWMHRVPGAKCDCCGGLLPACACCSNDSVQVVKTEEKGSDVNLAVQLVSDGFQNLFDTAFVVSDDSDIQPAVDVVRGQLGKRVVVADPRNRPHPSLVGDDRRKIRRPALEQSQFASPVMDAVGREIARPAGWG